MNDAQVLSWIEEKSVIYFKEQNQKAYLNLCVPPKGMEYSVDIIKKFLNSKNIVFGIMEEEIKQIFTDKKFYLDVLVAAGSDVVDGRDGFLRIKFDTKDDNKPHILPDGSVDYSTLGHIDTISAGEEIAVYMKPVIGHDGINVNGVVIPAYRGREQQALKGKGFTMEDCGDCIKYIAATSGRVELKNGTLNVSNLLEIKNDVDNVSGDVIFSGDVIIHGNVIGNMTINADGNVNITGNVEAATIIAGGDVVLNSGMQGAMKGSIWCGGNVSGKFFEQTTIRAKGNVNANSILNCEIDAGEDITVSGKLGIIVGGNIKAAHSISATAIGNIAEVKTYVQAGVSAEALYKINSLENQIETYKQNIEKLDKINFLLNEKERKDGGSDDINRNRMQCMRSKITINSDLSNAAMERKTLLDKVNKSADSKIVVSRSIHPGVSVMVNGKLLKIPALVSGVMIRVSMDKAAIFALY